MHKKGNKPLVNNYRPLSVLPICFKIFEKLILDCIYDFLDYNSLFNANQSGFGSGDLRLHQLVSCCT